MRLPGRRGSRGPAAPAVAVRPGERVLASAAVTTSGGAVAGTRAALYLAEAGGGEPVRLAWEDVESAEWDAEEAVLRVVPVGTWGEERREHAVALDRPERLLQLVRERVTASIVLQRHVAVEGRRGLRVVARRAPTGGPLRWFHEYDPGVDPADPAVRRVADQALAAAQEEVGGGA